MTQEGKKYPVTRSCTFAIKKEIIQPGLFVESENSFYDLRAFKINQLLRQGYFWPCLYNQRVGISSPAGNFFKLF